MKIIWNDEPTAPEAPFFAAPQAEEELEPLDEEEEEEEEDSPACSWRAQGFGS
jgi:hypothetical protein